MNLHKNARTCPKSRALMVSRVLEDRRAVAEVATEMGVSRRTVYKWVQRYCEGGEAALQDGSSEPGVLHHQLGQDWVDLIVELRTEYKMTALRIARQLDLARSTVAGVLQREGISQLKQLVPKEPVVRYEHDGPGEMIHIDIKKLGRFWRAGHRVTGNRKQDSQGAGWEYVHICIDDYSRVAYAEVLVIMPLTNQRRGLSMVGSCVCSVGPWVIHGHSSPAIGRGAFFGLLCCLSGCCWGTSSSRKRK